VYYRRYLIATAVNCAQQWQMIGQQLSQPTQNGSALKLKQNYDSEAQNEKLTQDDEIPSKYL
jgi:hypothetical protein